MMGFFSWLSSVPKKGVNYGRKVIGGDQIEENAKYIGSMVSGLKKDAARQETFENAYTRLGLTEDDLEKSYAFYAGRFNLFLMFFALGFVFFIYFMFSSFMSSLAVLGFLAICASQLFNASFRAYQIRSRELHSVANWSRHPREWWIKEFNKKTNKPSRSLKIVKK